MTSQPCTGQSTSYGDVKSSYGGAGGWDRCGCTKGAPKTANRHGEEQHKHTERGSHTRRDKGEHSRQGGGAQQGRRGNQNSGSRELEWKGWQSVRMGGSDNKGDSLASHPRRYRLLGQALLNRHQVGGVSCSPDGLLVQQQREPGQRVEEQGTWASRTRKHSEAGYGRPVDRGAWTAKTVKRPRQQPAHPQYTNYWVHTMPHSAQPQHTNYWAPRTRKRHQQKHRPQRPTESSNPTQHAKGRTGDCPGPRKGTTTRRNATGGGGGRRGGKPGSIRAMPASSPPPHTLTHRRSPGKRGNQGNVGAEKKWETGANKKMGGWAKMGGRQWVKIINFRFSRTHFFCLSPPPLSTMVSPWCPLLQRLLIATHRRNNGQNMSSLLLTDKAGSLRPGSGRATLGKGNVSAAAPVVCAG